MSKIITERRGTIESILKQSCKPQMGNSVLNGKDVALLAKVIANVKVMRFLYWFTYSEDTIEGQSKKKAYQLFGRDFLKTVEHGNIKCLFQCHV